MPVKKYSKKISKLNSKRSIKSQSKMITKTNSKKSSKIQSNKSLFFLDVFN